MKRIAIIRIRGDIKVRKDIKDTLRMLKLFKKNSCVIIPNKPQYVGMIKKVKDYVTWGEIDEKTFSELVIKRGRIAGNKKIDEKYFKDGFDDFIKGFFSFKKELKDVPGLKGFFRLNPPVKGFERKGIKIPFALGGALGYRKEKINDLIKRMI